jgi:hypothetical protein
MLKRFLKRNILGAILTILVLPSIALSAVLLVPQGGTGLSTCSVGGILRGNGQNAMSCLGIGTNGQVLTVSGGQPTWQDPTGGGSGTVESVAMTVPTGLQVSGSPITDSGTLTVSLASGYVIPLTASTTDWQTAFGWGNHATAGYLDSGDIANFETTTQLNTRDTNNRARANHTGTQLASTISDFDTTARGLFSSSATGLTYTSGTGVFSLTGGYNIPLTASTTAWNTFYNTPSNRITAGTGLSWSGNTLNATGGGTVESVSMTVPTGLTVSGSPITTTGTLAVSLAGGYNIPLTASTTNWNTFYNTPSNRITAGTGLSWAGNTLNGHVAVTIGGEDYLSLSTQAITANAIDPDNLSASDFGSFTCNGTTCTVDTGAVSNAMLANSTVSYGGVSLALGASDATPAFALADATGLPISTGVSGLGAGIATFLGTPSSANLDTAVTDDTGSGALVFGTSPTITSPTLSTFFGTPCTGNQFLQDISDTGAFTCVTASGGGGDTTWDVVAGGVETATSTDFARASYFVATSSTATSTFAGNVVIEGNLIVDGDVDGAGIIALIALVVATMATVTLTFTNKTLTSPIINVGSDAEGDLYYRNSSGAFTRLPVGADGQVLTSTGTIPAWEDPAGASSFSRLDFEVMTAPATPASDVGTVYMTGSGTTPNRVLEWKFKNEEGEEIILSSVIV